EIPGKGEQHAEDTTRGADDLLLHTPGALHRDLREPAGDHTHEVVDQHARRAQVVLERAPEHEERKHVEEDVRQVLRIVEEAVGDQLPGPEQRTWQWTRR